MGGKEQGRREGGGQLGHFALGPTLLMSPKRSIYSNRTVKYSIKAVTTYICPGPLKLSLLPWQRATSLKQPRGNKTGQKISTVINIKALWFLR